MKPCFTYCRNTLLCFLLLFISWAAMAQDWTTVNPDLDLPYTPDQEFTYTLAITTGPEEIPSPYTLHSTFLPDEFAYRFYVMKYTYGAGWAQFGNDLPLTDDPSGTTYEVRIAPDGTAYAASNKYNRMKIFRLLPGASDWQQIANFPGNGNVGGILELDAQGTPYIEYGASGLLYIRKYVQNAWVLVNGPEGAPAQPPTPEGIFRLTDGTALAIADDGTIYTLAPAYNFETDASSMDLFTLSPTGEWHYQGSLNVSTSTSNRVQLRLNQNTGRVYIYGRNNTDTKYTCGVFDGNSVTSAEYEMSGAFSSWYPDGNGNAYLLRLDGGLVYLSKFDGMEWNEIGTPFRTTGMHPLISYVFAGTPDYLYVGFNRDAASPSPTVSKLLIGVLPQQTITFDAIPDKALGDAPFTLAATTNSGLDIAFSTSTADKITLSGNQVTMMKAGRATIKATQAGDADWSPASVERSFCIAPAKPTLELTLTDPAAPVIKSSASSNVWYLDGQVIANQTGATLTAKAPGVYTASAKADNCTGDLSDELNLFVTGIEKEYTSVKVFPNPAEDFIEVKGLHVKNNSFEVIDMTGRKRTVSFEEVADGYRVDIRSLDKSVYIIRVNDRNTLRQIKFVKK